MAQHGKVTPPVREDGVRASSKISKVTYKENRATPLKSNEDYKLSLPKTALPSGIRPNIPDNGISPRVTLSDSSMAKATKERFTEISDYLAVEDPAGSEFTAAEEPVLMLSPLNAAQPIQRSAGQQLANIIGIFLSVTWLAICFSYAQHAIGWQNMMNFMPHELGGFLAGAIAPVALFWMVLAYIQRGLDVQKYAEALRGELQALIFPSEEREARVHQDIERLVRQAAELSTASKSTLKAIHQARKGLKAEVLDFAGLSEDAENNMARLSDILHNRSLAISKLAGEIELRVSRIAEKSDEGVLAWDEATQELLTRAKEMEAALGTGAESMLIATDRMQDKAETVRQTLHETTADLMNTSEEVTIRLEGISSDFGEHTDKIAEVARIAREEADRLDGIMDQHIKGVEAATSRMTGAITASTASVEQQRNALEESGKDAVKRAGLVIEELGKGVRDLREASAGTADKAADIAKRLSAPMDSLADIIMGLSTQAGKTEAAAVDAVRKLGEATALTASGADAIEKAVSRNVKTLNDAVDYATEQAQRLTTSVGDESERFVGSADEAFARIEGILALFESNKDQLDNMAGDARGQVMRLNDVMNEQARLLENTAGDVERRIESITNHFMTPLSDLKSAVEQAADASTEIDSTLVRRIDDLNAATEKAVEQAGHIRDSLLAQSREISKLSGEVAGNAHTVNEQLDQQSTKLSDKVRDSLHQLGQVHQALTKQSDLIGEASGQAHEKIESLRGVIAEQYHNIKDSSAATEQTLKTLNEQLGIQAARVAKTTSESRNEFENFGQILARRTQDAETASRVTLQLAADVVEQLEILRENCDKSSEEGIARMTQVTQMFDQRLGSIKEDSSVLANTLRSVGEDLHHKVKDIEKIAEFASQKVTTVGRTLQGQAEDIHLVTDKAALRMEAVQKAISAQFHDLSSSIGQAMSQIQDAGDQFKFRADEVDTSADRIARRFEEIGQHARAEVSKFSEVATHTASLTDQVVGKLQQGSGHLVERANYSLQELKKAGEEFAARAESVANEINTALETSRVKGALVREDMSNIAGLSAKATERIVHAAEALSGQIERIGQSTENVAVRIDRSTENLSRQSEKISLVSEDTARKVDDAISKFARQSQDLMAASRDALEHSARVQDQDFKAQRDAFFQASKFVIESLHSLSVDFTRVLDGELPEKTWRLYQKGDTGVFTRRLVQIQDKVPVDRLRDKYVTDTEFRTYVQRYVRQFEEVFDQADALDHGDLLTSTFMSSDVGKLYQFLCMVLGREGREIKELASAA